MDGLRDDHRDDMAPYGVDTIRLRISFPAAPVSRGYNGRAWGMRPLRGWTGAARLDAQRAEGEAAAPAYEPVSGSELIGAQGGSAFDDDLVQEVQFLWGERRRYCFRRFSSRGRLRTKFLSDRSKISASGPPKALKPL